MPDGQLLFDVQAVLHCGFGDAVTVAVAVDVAVLVAVAVGVAVGVLFGVAVGVDVAQTQLVAVLQVDFLQFPVVAPFVL